MTTFKEVGNLRRIIILDQQGELFAAFSAEPSAPPPLAFTKLVIPENNDYHQFVDGYLIVQSAVFIEDEQVGTVALESTQKFIHEHVLLFVIAGAGTSLLGIILSVVLLRRLQQWVLRPVIHISDVAETVATTQSYHLRANVSGNDEIARLGRRFNQLLECIEIWDKSVKEELNERRQSEQYLGTLVKTDDLTCLANRVAFLEDLEQAIGEYDQGVIAVLFMDLDDFKYVNDRYGHHVGDIVLQMTAKRIAGVLRQFDRVYRLGGDEFAVISQSVQDEEQVRTVCERIIETVQRKISYTEGTETISSQIGVSIGFAFYPVHAQTANGLLRCADIAMYNAKRQGKNGYQKYVAPLESG